MSKQEVICGDCTKIELPPYDILIADPPYAERVHRDATSSSPIRGVRHRDLGFGHLTPELRLKVSQLAANAQRWAIIYSDTESVSYWRDDLVKSGATYVRTMPWVRWSSPQLSGDRPPQGFECVLVAYGKKRGRKHWNGPGNLTHFAHKALRGEDKHKSEKPLDQMLDIVDYFSDPGETILDPCAGYATVGLAARILGRNYYGIELDPIWATRAQTRLVSTLSKRDQVRMVRWEESKRE